MAAPLSIEDVSNYLAHKLYRDELGRVGSAKEVEWLAGIIRTAGIFESFVGVYGSEEAKRYRKKVGREV